MAASKAPKIEAMLADEAIFNGCAVKFGSDEKHVGVGDAATDLLMGIAQNDVTAAEQMVEVATPGGGALAKAGDTITAGQYLSAETNGRLVPASTANNRIIAIALAGGVDGDMIPVHVLNFNY